MAAVCPGGFPDGISCQRGQQPPEPEISALFRNAAVDGAYVSARAGPYAGRLSPCTIFNSVSLVGQHRKGPFLQLPDQEEAESP